ncbi:MAG TPA: lysophospholipid acyltransferase family protein [Candidatus Omnitrophota bacterium]|nr:lysophospholipid acyltransferase family protein [Candidatus Omnitrophota bacterium]HRZ14783.1 lysophospholipid acyltransferase family protein [Candidatus Omnitrophota bacterium]
MWYFIFRFTSNFVLRIFFRLKVEGIEYLPKKTNFIIVSNHTSFLDPVVIGACIPHKIYCIALRDLFKDRFFRWAFRKLDALPSGSSAPIAIQLLRENKNVGLFPEGGISRNGQLKEFRSGAAVLAYKTGRPIVPCAISGTFQALPFGARIPRLVRIRVKIGKPVYLLKEFDDIIDDIKLQEGINRVRTTISEMLNAE